MYPEIDKIEKEQVEWVFGLTGGELSDKPLRYAEIEYDPGIPSMVLKGYPEYAPKHKIVRHWARYFYDGVPDYVEREHRDGGTYITIVTCLQLGNFGMEAPSKIYMHGKVWRRVASYTHSGEAECPGKDDGDGIVEAKHCSPSSTGTHECVLCGEKKGEGHRFIYLGDGWAEVVYRSRA